MPPGGTLSSNEEARRPSIWEGYFVLAQDPEGAQRLSSSALGPAIAAESSKPWGRLGLPEMWPLSKILTRQRNRNSAQLLKSETLLPSDQAALHHKLSEADFYMLRLDCDFRLDANDPPRVRLDQASYTMRLHSPAGHPGPIVYDFDPKTVTQPVKQSTEKGLSPSLSIDNVTVSAGSIKRTMSYDELIPTVIGGGAGTAEASWDFRPFRKESIVGSRRMYVVVKAPKGQKTGQADFDLTLHLLVKNKWRFRWQPQVPAGKTLSAQIWPEVRPR